MSQSKDYKPNHGGCPFNLVSGSGWENEAYANRPNAENGLDITQEARNMANESNVLSFSRDPFMQALGKVDTTKVVDNDPVQHVAEIMVSDSPRKTGFSYGIGWGSTDPFPPIYFEAVQLEATESIDYLINPGTLNYDRIRRSSCGTAPACGH
jgi:hypothetical protein